MSRRIQQINRLIRKEISQDLLKEVEFPKNILVTVTRVKTTSDLRESKVYVSVMPEERSQFTFDILNQKIYKLQQMLNHRLRMKPVPKIKFIKEEETKRAGRVEELLKEIEDIKK